MDLKHCDYDEMADRLQVVYVLLDAIMKEIGPKIEQISVLRQEAELLLSEIKQRDEKESKSRKI